MKEIYKKWYFWLIIIVIIIVIANNQTKKNETKEDSNSSPYSTKYEWKNEDVKSSEIIYDNGDIETVSYIVLPIESKEKDLQSGTYEFKTSEDDKATFIIYITDKLYEDAADLPEPYTAMIQGSKSTELKLEKGQYLYIVKGSTGTGNGKIIIEKK